MVAVIVVGVIPIVREIKNEKDSVVVWSLCVQWVDENKLNDKIQLFNSIQFNSNYVEENQNVLFENKNKKISDTNFKKRERRF